MSDTLSAPIPYSPDSIELADVRGWLNDDEGRLLAKYAAGKRVLEVGSYCGRSTIWMARVAESVVAVDTWQEGTEPEFWANIHQHKLTNVLSYTGPIQHPAFAAGVYKQRFDFIFIDADHSYYACSNDIRTCLPLLAPGGLLALHDYHSYQDLGVTWAADELIRQGAEVVDQAGMVLVLRPGR